MNGDIGCGHFCVVWMLDPCSCGCGSDRLWIEHADPRVLITDETLKEIQAGRMHRHVTLTGGVLRIEAENRTVLYRLVAPYLNGVTFCWIAEWPD